MKPTSWLEFNQSERGEGVVIGYNAAEPLWVLVSPSVDELIAKLQEVKTTAKTWKVAPVAKPIPKIVAPAATIGKKRILLDPGHSKRLPGATGKSSLVREEVLNMYQAQCLKMYLEVLGHTCDIYDPQEDDLYEIGSRARGYDMFISLHLNACDGREHYTCAMVHKKYSKIASAEFASKWAIKMAEAIGNPVFSGSPGYPKGVMAAGLGVLNGAENSGCPICILSELEFMDDETSDGPIKARIEKAMQAGAKLIADVLG